MKYWLLGQPFQEVVLPCRQLSFFCEPGVLCLDFISLFGLKVFVWGFLISFFCGAFVVVVCAFFLWLVFFFSPALIFNLLLLTELFCAMHADVTETFKQ